MDFLVVCEVAPLLKQALLVKKVDVRLRYIEALEGTEKFRSVVFFCRICNFLAGMCWKHGFRFLSDRQCLSRQPSTVSQLDTATQVFEYLSRDVMALTIVMILYPLL